MRWTTACTLLKIAETREPSYQPHVDQPRLHGEVVEQGGGRWPGRSPPPIGRTYLVGDGGVVVINCRLIWVAMSKFKLTTHQWGLGCAAEPMAPNHEKEKSNSGLRNIVKTLPDVSRRTITPSYERKSAKPLLDGRLVYARRVRALSWELCVVYQPRESWCGQGDTRIPWCRGRATILRAPRDGTRWRRREKVPRCQQPAGFPARRCL